MKESSTKQMLREVIAATDGPYGGFSVNIKWRPSIERTPELQRLLKNGYVRRTRTGARTGNMMKSVMISRTPYASQRELLRSSSKRITILKATPEGRRAAL